MQNEFLTHLKHKWSNHIFNFLTYFSFLLFLSSPLHFTNLSCSLLCSLLHSLHAVLWTLNLSTMMDIKAWSPVSCGCWGRHYIIVHDAKDGEKWEESCFCEFVVCNLSPWLMWAMVNHFFTESQKTNAQLMAGNKEMHVCYLWFRNSRMLN